MFDLIHCICMNIYLIISRSTIVCFYKWLYHIVTSVTNLTKKSLKQNDIKRLPKNIKWEYTTGV